MSTFAHTYDQTKENTMSNTILDKMSFSEQIAKLSKLPKQEKIKFIFFCFVHAHGYSIRGNKLDRDFLLTLNDICTTNENLKKFIYDQFNPFLSEQELAIIGDYSTSKINENTEFTVYNVILLLTDLNFCEFIDEKVLVKLLINSFFNYYQDFSHPFVGINDDFNKLSHNVKKGISIILQDHIELLHNDKPQNYEKSQYDKFIEFIQTIDELLEFSLFIAKYGKLSSIGYFINMKYKNNNPLDIFNKKTLIDEIIESYGIQVKHNILKKSVRKSMRKSVRKNCFKKYF